MKSSEVREISMEENEWEAFKEVYNTTDYWEGRTSNYGDYSWESNRDLYVHLVDLVLRGIRTTFTKDAPILDVGSGPGHIIRAFWERGFTRVLGCDISKVAIQASPCPIFFHDITKPLPLPKGTFSLVTAFDVLEHIPSNKVLTTLGNLQELLVPEGFLAAHIPFLDDSKDMGHLTVQPLGFWVERFSQVQMQVQRGLYHGTQMLLIIQKVSENKES